VWQHSPLQTHAQLLSDLFPGGNSVASSLLPDDSGLASNSSADWTTLGAVDKQLISQPIDSRVRIGHTHLKVADLGRALTFWHDVLGFEIMQRMGRQAAFLSAGGYHHHIGLNTWESAGGSPPPPGTTGLFHVAILYPTRPLLADALRRVLAAGVELDGAADHGVSEALYLRDPDDNGVELYWDRPQEQWPRNNDGSLAMFTRALDLDGLLKEKKRASG
jgi:catechol 2,3-dioxygenase